MRLIGYRDLSAERTVLPFFQTTVSGGYASGILIFPGSVAGTVQAAYARRAVEGVYEKPTVPIVQDKACVAL